ncbi:MAG: helix-turn-helix domain-containing protein, partial [Betaproteobacteria bacterium]
MAKAQRGIQSIEVGGALLRALVDADTPLPLRELAQRAGMSSARAHPYVVSFGKLGLVEQDPVTGHY